MTTASPAVHAHAQQNGNGVGGAGSGVENANAYPGSIPRPANDTSAFLTFVYTFADVIVFLAISIGYILQVSQYEYCFDECSVSALQRYHVGLRLLHSLCQPDGVKVQHIERDWIG